MQNASALMIQNAFRNKKAIDEFASKYAGKIIERKIMDTANDVVSQINRERQSAATKLQNAFRNKKAINEFSSRYSKKLKEEENKQRQKEVFKKLTALYQPQEDLILKKTIIRPTEPKLSVEADRKERQRKVFEKYSNLLTPQNNLRYKPF